MAHALPTFLTASSLRHILFTKKVDMDEASGINLISFGELAMSTETCARDLVILPDFVGRSGPIGMIAVLNRTRALAEFVSSYLRCDVGDGSEDDPKMLFAIPLESGCGSRKIEPGVNVFDLFIQGFDYGRNPTKIYRKSFEYIFAMVKQRSIEMTKGQIDPARSDFLKVASQLLQAIVSLPNNDLIEEPEIFGVLDKSFRYSVRVKLIADTGEFVRQRIHLKSLDASQWLANYLEGNEGVLLNDVQNTFQGISGRG